MTKATTFAGEILALVLNGAAIAGLAQNGSSPLTNLYIALHTADVGAGGSQNTNEATYTGYARVAVVRTGAGWTVTGNSASPAAAINFPLATAGTQTLTHLTIGTAATGAGKVLLRGTISPAIVIAPGATPQLTTGTTVAESTTLP